MNICDTATNFFLDIARVWLNEHKDVTPNNFFSHYAWDTHFKDAIKSWVLDNKKEEIKAIRNSI